MKSLVRMSVALCTVSLLAGHSCGYTIVTNVTERAAADMLSDMDLTVDPCQDFFQYACGGWLKKHPIPKSASRWSVFDSVDEKLTAALKRILTSQSDTASHSKPLNQSKIMYSACTDKASIEQLGIAPMMDYLKQFGSMPMTVRHWSAESFDWQNTTASAITTYGATYLLSITNDLDLKNTSQSVIYVDQGFQALPKSMFVNSQLLPELKKAYKEYMIESAKAIRDYLRSGVDDAQIEADVADVWDFETQFAKITRYAEERRNSSEMYNPILLSELQQWTDRVCTSHSHAKMNWSKLLNDIYSSVNISIPNDERIIVTEPDYLRRLVALLDRTSPRVLANYFHWRMVNDLAADTNQRMLDLQLQFAKVQTGVSAPVPRVNVCANKVNDLMGFALSSVYSKNYFTPEAKSEIEALVGNLKSAFKSLVDEAAWMDEPTKAIAKDKVNAMQTFVGYPDWIYNNTAMDEYYDGLRVSTSTHFLNIQNANMLANQQSLESLRQTPDRTDWNTFPTTVNAFYTPEFNSITFPAAILQPPYFAMGRMEAMNYGSIGSVIGHEITHGFDDEGRQSDKCGNTVQWWTDSTLANFLVRAQCFIDEYSNFTVGSGSHLNGKNTQGENIADNGGLRESFRAYKNYVASHGVEPKPSILSNFTNEQIFFLSYARNWCGVETPEEAEDEILTDPHSINRFRVIGPLTNNDDFANAFHCAPGTAMNQAKKCVLW